MSSVALFCIQERLSLITISTGKLDYASMRKKMQTFKSSFIHESQIFPLLMFLLLQQNAVFCYSYF